MRIDGLAKDLTIAQRAAPELRKLKKVSEGAESMFVKDLLAIMRKSVGKTKFGDNFGGEIYQDLFDQALAETAGRTSMLGIGKMLNDQFAKTVWNEARMAVRRDAINDGTQS